MQHETKRPVFPVWSLGDRLRKVRLTAGLDQRQFAEALGVQPGSLAAWETDRSTPRKLVDIAKTIEKVTGVPAAWTLGVSEPTQP